MTNQFSVQSSDSAKKPNPSSLPKPPTNFLVNQFESLLDQSMASVAAGLQSDGVKKREKEILQSYQKSEGQTVGGVSRVDRLDNLVQDERLHSSRLQQTDLSKVDEKINRISMNEVDDNSKAQAPLGVAQNAQDVDPESLNIVPLQIFLDNAIAALNRISRQEFKVNDLMNRFIEGDVSEDEVVLETAKLNLSISMVTTIVQSAVQTFKEIQNIPI